MTVNKPLEIITSSREMLGKHICSVKCLSRRRMKILTSSYKREFKSWVFHFLITKCINDKFQSSFPIIPKEQFVRSTFYESCWGILRILAVLSIELVLFVDIEKGVCCCLDVCWLPEGNLLTKKSPLPLLSPFLSFTISFPPPLPTKQG